MGSIKYIAEERKGKAILKPLRLARRFLFIFIAVLVFASPFLFSAAQADTGTSAFVWTDKTEYDPAETVRIFGYGFNAYAQVTVTIQRPDLSQDTIQTSTDEFGYFTCQYVLDGTDGLYSVTATDGVNTATTTFNNCLYLTVKLKICTIGTHIWAKAGGLSKTKSYYMKYFDPDGVERRTSPTYTGVYSFTDYYVILPTLPKILGTWTVKLYENGVLKKTRTVYVGKIVWTTDSSYTTMITSFAQGETVYFKAIGLLATKYYRFKMEKPDGTRFYVSNWTSGVTTLTGSYVLPTTAPLGTWKLHTREADDSGGTNEHHYVDCCFIVTTPPPLQQYYLTVRTDPPDITTIPGQGWYNASTLVNLTAPEFVPGSTGVRYRFDYWDVDGTPNATGVYEITVHMNANHTATAHYITQYYLNMTSNPPGVTTPAGTGWYDAGTNASIFAPEFVGITPNASCYRFDGWTTADMTEIDDPSATNTTVLMDKAKTVTANYVVQYKVTFTHTGLSPDATGTVVTVNSSAKTLGNLPFGIWVDTGSILTYSYEATVSSTISGKRYRLDSVTGPASPINVTSPATVTGNYVTQYLVTLAQTGLDSTATDTVVTVNGTPKTFGELPFSMWADNGSSITYNYNTIVASTVPGKRFRLDSVSSPPSPFTVTGPVTITGNYKAQYQLTVRTSGLGTRVTNVYNGTTVLGTATDATPYTNWFDRNSQIQLDIDSPVTGSPTRFVFTQWSGDATGTSRPVLVTMNSVKDVTANYKTQYQITVTASPSGALGGTFKVTYTQCGTTYTNVQKTTPWTEWVDASTNVIVSEPQDVINVTADTRYKFNSYNPSASVHMDQAKAITLIYKIQYLLMVRTDPPELSPQPTRNPLGEAGPPSSWWYDNSTNVNLTAQPVSGYVFLNWDVDGTNVTGNPINVHMDANHTATAHYGELRKCVVDFTEDPGSPIRFGTKVTFTVNVTQKAFNGTHEVNCTLYEWNLTDPNGVPHILRFGKQWNNFSDTMQWTFNVYGQWTVILKAFCNDTVLIDAGMAWSDPVSHIKYVSPPVGGYIVPVCKLDLLMPWTGFVLGPLAAMAVTIALFRLRSRKH